ncbi:MAG: cation diffusion facilitator family transporter [Bacteroidetes bacterium]|nr:cation diffusion facilitator family transporter [Bacteroidota bacterium]
MGRNHPEPVSGRNLVITVFLNLAITIAEVIGGILSNSLALLSDALHNLSDTIALFIAWIANKISRRASNDRKTFGYKRVEILAAFLNSLVLILVSVFLFIEAVKRFMDPEPIRGQIMFIVATAGLAANLISVLILRKDSGKNINIRSAYLHLLSDTLSSVAVIIGGILIYFFDLFWIDPLVTVLISLYILRETWFVFRETVDILMQGTPRGMSLNKIKAEVEKIPGIANVHHVHLWNLNDSLIHFECHVIVSENIRVSDTKPILETIERMLMDQFGITHITVQFEYNVDHERSSISERL